MIYKMVILIYSMQTVYVVVFFVLCHLWSFQYNQSSHKVYDTTHICNQSLMCYYIIFVIVLYLIIVIAVNVNIIPSSTIFVVLDSLQ